MKYITSLLFTLAFTLTLSSYAQEPVTWKGGTPGRETSWNEARNWSNCRVPDESSHVLIKALHTGHHAQPVISDDIEVASITIYTGASLTVKAGGELLIDGSYQYTAGIVNQGGLLINEGIINLQEIEGETPNMWLSQVTGTGSIWIDEVQLTSYSEIQPATISR